MTNEELAEKIMFAASVMPEDRSEGVADILALLNEHRPEPQKIVVPLTKEQVGAAVEVLKKWINKELLTRYAFGGPVTESEMEIIRNMRGPNGLIGPINLPVDLTPPPEHSA